MSMNGTVSDYMSANPLCLRASDVLESARDMFVQNGFTVAPVVDEAGVALGVISATDLLGSTTPGTVGDLTSGRLFTAQLADSIVEAAVMMTDCGVHHLVILDGDGKPIGILSNIDVARAVSDADMDQPVSYVMSDEVITVDRGMSIVEAAEMLAEANFSSAPVVEDGRVVGVVSRLGLLRAQGAGDSEGAERADEIMDDGVHTTEPHTRIASVARMFAEEGARRVFVVGPGYDVVGVVTATDIAGFVGSYLDEGRGVT